METLKNNLLSQTLIENISLSKWCESHPLLLTLMNTEPLFWANPKLKDAQKSLNNLSINKKDLEESSQRLNRFEPFLSEVFSELKNNGIIESKLLKVDTLQNKLSQHFKMTLPGNLYLKCDHQLPISGAIKARGGFYELLKLAEKIAL